MAAEDRGPSLHARVGMLRALNRHVERVFDPSRKAEAGAGPVNGTTLTFSVISAIYFGEHSRRSRLFRENAGCFFYLRTPDSTVGAGTGIGEKAGLLG
jgi:hypothetical protein